MCQMTNDEFWPEGIDFALAGKNYDELTDEEKEDLDEAAQLESISHMPARVKCAELGWRTLSEIIGE